VPILLGLAILDSGTAGAAQAYQVIFVIVGFSVTVQGGLVPALAHRLRIPLRTVEPEPWSLGVRFSEELEGLHRYHVAPGATADGSAVGDLPCGEDAGSAWSSGTARCSRSAATPPCRPGTTSSSWPTPTSPPP
jgi:cell volume regulation protein A